MNILLRFLLSGVALGGTLIPTRSVKAQLPDIKDVELRPLVVNAHAYAPHREAFENCWKSIRPEMAFDASSKLVLGEGTAFFRYESAQHHFRSVVYKESKKTFASLTHFDGPGDAPDLLVFISQAEEITPEHLKQYLEYLPLGVPAQALSAGYPLKSTGEEDTQITMRDVYSFAYRMAAPFVRFDFPMPAMPGQARDPKPNAKTSKP